MQMMLYIRKLILHLLSWNNIEDMSKTSVLSSYHYICNCLQLNTESSQVILIISSESRESNPTSQDATREALCSSIWRYAFGRQRHYTQFHLLCRSGSLQLQCDASILSYVLSTLKRMQQSARSPASVPIARRNSPRITIDSECGPSYSVHLAVNSHEDLTVGT